jgi:hypothetical protein
MDCFVCAPRNDDISPFTGTTRELTNPTTSSPAPRQHQRGDLADAQRLVQRQRHEAITPITGTAMMPIAATDAGRTGAFSFGDLATTFRLPSAADGLHALPGMDGPVHRTDVCRGGDTPAQ